MRALILAVVLALVSAPSLAQERTKIANGATLPAACGPGDLFAKTEAPNKGLNWCDASNTWVNINGLVSGGGAPTDATYLAQTCHASLSAEQCLSALTDGLLKHASGVLARAVPGTDYVATDDARLSDARTPTSHTHAESDVTNLTTDLSAKEAAANKGAASGYASLDAGTKVTGRVRRRDEAAGAAGQKHHID